MNTLAGKKILVVGGCGFLGSHICEALLQEGAEITVLDIAPAENIINLAHIKQHIHFITGSVSDEHCVDSAVQGMDVVIDTSFPAAKCDRAPGNQHVAVGTVGVFNLLKAALSEEAKFIFASSISVYGVQQFTPIHEQHPLNPFLLYSATKLAGENYCKIMADNYNAKVTILRFSDIYGPRDGRMAAPVNFLNKALKGESLLIHGDGQQIRSYIYITDAARATVCALKNFKQGGIFNVTGKEPLSILDLARIARQVAGVNVPISLVPSSNIDPRNYIIDGTLAAKEIMFTPQVDIFQGLSNTLQWLKERAD